ncbi:DUF4349 domain-containing protein [Streptomyces sp. NPDC094437]|uniref:DUF4349 domain-containing protein n=1 Tax=Streptomyces sp. NPDC094437 TaxID=3366060 RepID=UPI0038247B9D
MRTRRSTGPVHALSGLLLAAALALTGCSGDSDTSGGSASGTSAAQEDLGSGDKAAPGDAESSASELTEGHIIRTAELTVRVEDVDKALRAARTTTRDAGGYVGEESTVRDDGGPAYTTVTLRVPVAEYDAVLADLQGAGVLLERSARARDVTDKVVDVESRVTSRRAQGVTGLQDADDGPGQRLGPMRRSSARRWRRGAGPVGQGRGRRSVGP